MESSLHDALKDDDLVVIRAGGQGAQGLNVRGHVLQVMSPPHWTGEVGPALQNTAGNIGGCEDRKSCDMEDGCHTCLYQSRSSAFSAR